MAARALQRRRCSGGSPVGWSGLWTAATSMAAVLGSRGGGSRTAAAAPGADEKPSVRGRAKEEGNIWGGPFVPGESTTRDKRTFCPGSWLHPGQKGVFGRAGQIPSPRPTFSPGWIYHPGQKGPVFPRFPPNLMFVFVSFLLLF